MLDSILSGLKFGGAVVTSQCLSFSDALAQVKDSRHEKRLANHTPAELCELVVQLKSEMSEGMPPKTVATALSLIDEAAYRAAGIRYYDVQLQASVAMLKNEIAEMKTGEGKTYVGSIVCFVRSLQGQGVHFMTTNAYLAERDHEIVKPLLEQLGVSVSLLDREMSPQEKQAAYLADITYGPGYEFGFDYLRDQLTLINEQKPKLGQRLRRNYHNRETKTTPQMQRDRFCAIVDEADSVMIDDATTPLVLSSSIDRPHPAPLPFLTAKAIASELDRQQDYVINPATRTVSLTQPGADRIDAALTQGVRGQLSRAWPKYVEQAIIAQNFFSVDEQYIIRDDKVRMVDSSTGRIFEDRSWSEGLHQAVEAKENVTISDENSSVARISRQQYFRLYANLCGMTGTAADAQRELRRVYRLPVAVIPTNKPCPRLTEPMRCFDTNQSKLAAIADTVRQLHETGQPILVGTRTIDKSELIASLISDLPVQVLNGKQDADEADLVAESGKAGAITIATNMAGRGTDIKLGEGVRELGGLYVIVSDPDYSARVDRQLIGRASRQGDPGASQMFVSAEDDLIARHAHWLVSYIHRLADENGEVQIDLSHEIRTLQQRVERKHAELRRQMFKRETWLEEALETMAK